MLSVDTRPSASVVPARPGAAASSSDDASASSFDRHLHHAVADSGDEDRTPTNPADSTDDPNSGAGDPDLLERSAAARRRELRVTADSAEAADPNAVAAVVVPVAIPSIPTDSMVVVAGVAPVATEATSTDRAVVPPASAVAPPASRVDPDRPAAQSAPTSADITAAALLAPTDATTAAATPGRVAEDRVLTDGTRVSARQAPMTNGDAPQNGSVGPIPEQRADRAPGSADRGVSSTDADLEVAPSVGEPVPRPTALRFTDPHDRAAGGIASGGSPAATAGVLPQAIVADGSSGHDATSSGGGRSGTHGAVADASDAMNTPAAVAGLDGSPRPGTDRSNRAATGSSPPTGVATTPGQSPGSMPGSARRTGPIRLDLDLTGEGLGPLRFRATTIGGQLRVALTATDEHVRATLSNHSADLRRDLESSGLDLASLDVGGSPAGQHGPGAGSRDPSGTDAQRATGRIHRSTSTSGTRSPIDRSRSSGAPTRPVSGRLDRLL